MVDRPDDESRDQHAPGASPRPDKYTEPPEESDRSSTVFKLRYEGMKLDNESAMVRVLSGLLRRMVLTRTESADQEIVRQGALICSTMDFDAVAAARARAETTRKRLEKGEERQHLVAREERSRSVAETSAAEVLRRMAPTLEKVHFDREQVRDLASKLDETNRDRVEAAIDDYRARILKWTMGIVEKQRQYVAHQRDVIAFALPGGEAVIRDVVAYLLCLLSIHGDPQGGLYECPEISGELWYSLGEILEGKAAGPGEGPAGELEQYLQGLDLGNLESVGRSLEKDQEQHIASWEPGNESLPLWHTFRQQQELLDERLGLSALPNPRLVFYADYTSLREVREAYRRRVREHAALEVEVDSGMFAERAQVEAKQKLDVDGDGTYYQQTLARIRSGEYAEDMLQASAGALTTQKEDLKEKEGALYYRQLMEFAESVRQDARASALECFVRGIRDGRRSAWGGRVLHEAATRLKAMLG